MTSTIRSLTLPQSCRAAELQKRLGTAGLWPLAPGEWDDDTFYGLIEVYHDLVSRPRERHFHDYAMCGWHYSHFSATAGREIYRWRANELLQAAGISYRLADSGEDQGRLVAVFDDSRSTLLAAAVAVASPAYANTRANANSYMNTAENVDVVPGDPMGFVVGQGVSVWMNCWTTGPEAMGSTNGSTSPLTTTAATVMG